METARPEGRAAEERLSQGWFKAARHQCLKIDQPQLVKLVRLAFQDLRPEERLWQRSGSTLRARFQKLLAALGIPPHAVANVKDFDLASLRAGGATWLMTHGRYREPRLCEKEGQVDHHEGHGDLHPGGRSHDVPPRLSPERRQHIFGWTNAFDEVFEYVVWCKGLRVPSRSSLFLLQQGVFHA
eukprot:s4113_g3.t1